MSKTNKKIKDMTKDKALSNLINLDLGLMLVIFFSIQLVAYLIQRFGN